MKIILDFYYSSSALKQYLNIIIFIPRTIDTVGSRSSARAAARRFGVSASSAITLVNRWRRTGSYAPVKMGGQKKRRLSGQEDWLRQVISAEPDIMLPELRDRLADRGIEISRQSINDMLHALECRYNKNRVRGGTRMR